MKKLISVLILFILAFTSISTPTLARNPMQGIDDYKTQVFDPAIEAQDVNLQSTVYEIYLSLISSMLRGLICDATVDESGTTIQGLAECIGQDAEDQIPLPSSGNLTTDAKYAPGTYYGGLIPNLMYTNTSFMSRPAISSTEYIAHVGDRLNLTQPAYAQGLGFAGLSPVLRVWQAFRNVAYLLATLGFLILAFMVMFRIRAGSQAVITAQSAITKLIFVVIAITFSYAIAGFVVDLLFLFTNLIITLFISTGLIQQTPANVQGLLLSGNVFALYGGLTGITKSAGQSIAILTDQLFDVFVAQGTLNWLSALFNFTTDQLSRLIIGIAILYSLFKLMVQLLFAYLQIILLTVLSPLMILPDILPGGNSFMTWLRNIFAHAMIFPATAFMFLVGTVIVGGSQSFGLQPAAAIDPNVGLKLPFLNFTGDALFPLIGVGFILITPKVNDMVRDAFKVSTMRYMSEIGSAVGVGAGMGTAPIRGVAGGAGKIGGGLLRYAADAELETRQDAAAASGRKGRAAFISGVRRQLKDRKVL